MCKLLNDYARNIARFGISLIGLKPDSGIQNMNLNYRKPDSGYVSLIYSIFLMLCSVSNADVSFNGLNHGELTLENKSRRFSFLNRLDLDLIYTGHGTLRCGGRFEIDESRREDTLIFIGFRQRYLEYQNNPLVLFFGNFYETFGNGFVLSTREDDVLKLDQNIDGLKMKYSKEAYELTGIVGRPLKDWVSQQRKDLILGLEAETKLLKYFGLSASYLRFNALEKVTDPSFGLATEERFGLSPNFTWRFLQINGEYARRFTWGRFDPDYGWVGVDNVKGRGVWLSINTIFSGLGIGLEAKKYTSFDGVFTNPPAAGKENRLLNNGKDETGIKLETNFSPTKESNFLVSFERGWSKEKDFLQLFLLEPRFEFSNMVIKPYYENHNEKGVIPAYPKKQDNIFGFEFIYANFFLEGEFLRGKESLATQITQNYKEFQITPGFGYGFIYFSFTLDWTNKKDDPSKNGYWLMANGYSYWSGVKLDFGEHQIILNYGKRRGKIECSGGYCRYEPAFAGFELEVTSRF